MEVIILAIITMVISAFSKRKSAGDANDKSKPFMSKPLNQKPMKKIEDYAKEVYGDVQKEISDRQTRSKPRPELKTQVKQVQKTLTPTKEQEIKVETPSRPGRLSLHQTTQVKQAQPIEKSSLVPSTEKELIQAIIFSEILASPKSKR